MFSGVDMSLDVADESGLFVFLMWSVKNIVECGLIV